MAVAPMIMAMAVAPMVVASVIMAMAVACLIVAMAVACMIMTMAVDEVWSEAGRQQNTRSKGRAANDEALLYCTACTLRG